MSNKCNKNISINVVMVLFNYKTLHNMRHIKIDKEALTSHVSR